jgi:hypothetical protein
VRAPILGCSCRADKIWGEHTFSPRQRSIRVCGKSSWKGRISFPCVMFSSSEFNPNQMKKAHKRKKDLPQREELPMRPAVPRSEQLLAQILTDDFCEFGSSEVIGVFVQQNFAS